jgi:hypothetical protein
LIQRVIMTTKSMSATKFKVLAAALLIGATVSQSVSAQHRHFRGPRVGVYIGAPLLAYSFYRPYYYPPYYYAPAYYPPVAVAPTYVEQPPVQQAPMYQSPQYQSQPYQPEPQQAAPQASGMWYYCNESRAYYPYVKSCPNGWQQVTPQPQN